MDLTKVIQNLNQFVLGHESAIRLMFPILLITGTVLVFIPLFIKNSSRLQKKANDSRTAFLTHIGKRYVQDYLNIPFTKWMDDTYKYSRFYRTSAGRMLCTSARYFMFTFGVGVCLMLASIMLTDNRMLGVALFFITFMISYSILFNLRIMQKQAVSRELMNFLNLMGNYSTANTEIFTVFTNIAPMLTEPLQSCLYECVSENHDSEKSKTAALKNLANKIEDPKFKEIIKNLEMAQYNSSSFSQVVSVNRKSLMNYIHGKKMRASIARQNLVSFLVILSAIAGIVFFLGKVVGENVFLLMVTTPVGIGVSMLAFIIILYFVMSTLNAGK